MATIAQEFSEAFGKPYQSHETFELFYNAIGVTASGAEKFVNVRIFIEGAATEDQARNLLDGVIRARLYQFQDRESDPIINTKGFYLVSIRYAPEAQPSRFVR